MPNRNRPDNSLKDRDRCIYDAWVGGTSQAQLAKEFALSQGRVSQIIKNVEGILAKEFASRQGEVRLRHTRRLENIYDMAIKAFLKSTGDKVTRKEVEEAATATEGNGDAKNRRELTRVSQAGDPNLLGKAMQALAEIRRMWGFNEPEGMPYANAQPYDPASPEEAGNVTPQAILLELLSHDPSYIEYLRVRATDSDARIVGSHGQSQPLAFGTAPSTDRPDAGGRGNWYSDRAPADSGDAP